MKKDSLYYLHYLCIQYMKSKPVDLNKNRNADVLIFQTLVYFFGELNLIYSLRSINNFKFLLKGNNIDQGTIDLLLITLKSYQAYPTQILQMEKILINIYFQINRKLENTQEVIFKKYLIHNELQYSLTAKQITEINKYFVAQKRSFILNHSSSIAKTKNNVLLPEIYYYFGLNLDEISKMNSLDIEKVNKEIYNFFEIDINNENKIADLIRKYTYDQKYGNKITSGSGYIDTLLIAAMMATLAFLFLLITILI